MTDEDRRTIQAMLDAAVQSIAARQDRAVEAITANLSDLRTELTTRLDRLERRTERTEVNTNALLLQAAGISRSLTEAERIDSTTAATQAAQQRAIDQLAARLTALEQKVSGYQPPQ